MSIFSISDLHLSKVNPKPMDVFGNNWSDHWDKIRNFWKSEIACDDYVIIPGDISWAINLDEALPDIMEISCLPGKKILLEGNHDYWWSSPAKIRRILPKGMEIIQNDTAEAGDYYICGSRGWILPGNEKFQEKDEKIYKRELIRLELSLSKTSQNPEKPVIAALHYPPFNEKGEPSGFVEILKKYNVKKCVYGHLHSDSTKNAFEGVFDGIEFFLVSCDYLDFKVKKISD